MKALIVTIFAAGVSLTTLSFAQAITLTAAPLAEAAKETSSVVEVQGCGRGYQGLDVALAQPIQHLWRRSNGDGDRAEGTLTGADDIRIPDVRLAIADDEAGDASRIGGAQNRPQIAGFLEPFGDDVKRQTPRRENR